MAAAMYGTGTEYSVDGNTKFIQDGAGNTTIYTRPVETTRNEFGEIVSKGVGDWPEKGETIPTIEALKRRGLSGIYTPPESWNITAAANEDEDDEAVLNALNTKDKEVVQTLDITGQEAVVDSSGNLPKGVYIVKYDDGTSEKKVVK